MFVCQCLAVTDGEIRAAIDDGARDVDALGRSCGAGTECGGCGPELLALLAEAGVGHDRLRQLSGRFAA